MTKKMLFIPRPNLETYGKRSLKYNQQKKKESVYSSLALPYLSLMEATYFKVSIDIPCSMDKTRTSFVFCVNFILKKKFHLWLTTQKLGIIFQWRVCPPLVTITSWHIRLIELINAGYRHGAC